MRRFAVGVIAVWLCAACGKDSGTPAPTPTPIASGDLTVQLVLPAAPDPRTNVARYRAIVRANDGSDIANETFDAGDTLQLFDLGVVSDATFILEGLDSGDTIIARGITLPFNLTETFGATVTCYFALVDTFSDVSGSPEARFGPAVASLSDGTVLIAGGAISGTAVDTTELYDPTTDTVTAGNPMASPHAFAPAVEIDNDRFLIAGGVDAAGAPSAQADVFDQDTWVAVPTMATARRDHAVVGVEGGQAIVFGGDAGAGPLATTEVFDWGGGGGGSAAWAPGDDMAVARRGAFAFPGLDPDEGFVGGGVTDQGGVNHTDNTWEFYDLDSNDNQGTFGANEDRRGFSGQILLADGTWLIVGGRQGNAETLLDTTLRLSVNPDALNPSPAATLPAPRAGGGGGVLADGRILLLGGEVDPPATPLDDTLLYDPSGDAFTPFGPQVGASFGGTVVPLPDGTTLVVSDGRVTRYNPPAP